MNGKFDKTDEKIKQLLCYNVGSKIDTKNMLITMFVFLLLIMFYILFHV